MMSHRSISYMYNERLYVIMIHNDTLFVKKNCRRSDESGNNGKTRGAAASSDPSDEKVNLKY